MTGRYTESSGMVDGALQFRFQQVRQVEDLGQQMAPLWIGDPDRLGRRARVVENRK